MTTGTGIYKALAAVMSEVNSVSKDERNTGQGFNFRGIDAVVNAVGPALRKHSVIVVPTVKDFFYSTIEIGEKRKATGHVRVLVEYAFYASDGSSIVAVTAGEAMDGGDKATAKAMSVAFRIALLQALCLPTSEPDPDASSYERSPVKKPVMKDAAVANNLWSSIMEAKTTDDLKVIWGACKDNETLEMCFDGSGVTFAALIGERVAVLKEKA